VIIRQAHAHDLDTIVDLRAERAAWLAVQGSDQWSDAGLDHDTFRQRVADSIAASETWMAIGPDGTALGTIAIDHHADSGLWSDTETAAAVIVHRMITRLASAGQGIGKALLDPANQIARAQGRGWVRLDAWTTNTGLHQLYCSHGFRHVRTVHGHISPSAALFERSSGANQSATPGEHPPLNKQPSR